MTVWDDWKEIAEKNGIDRKLFEIRIWNNGWSDEEAAIIPKNGRRNPCSWSIWKDVAEANGISKKTFRSRVWGYGFTPEEAAVKPLGRMKGVAK